MLAGESPAHRLVSSSALDGEVNYGMTRIRLRKSLEPQIRYPRILAHERSRMPSGETPSVVAGLAARSSEAIDVSEAATVCRLLRRSPLKNYLLSRFGEPIRSSSEARYGASAKHLSPGDDFVLPCLLVVLVVGCGAAW